MMVTLTEHHAQRRRFLASASAVIGGVGLVGLAVPFVASLNPSARARAAGGPVTVDFSKLEPGQQITVEWRGKPVWLLHRNADMLRRMGRSAQRAQLRDPDSALTSQQPSYARNAYRARKAHLFIGVGLCTHLGCIPNFRPDVAPADLGPDWGGGYFCPCHGSRFDLAGRVFRNVPAPRNLVVPPHRYLADTVVEIGVDETTT